ncbi:MULTISPECIES: cytochrome c oxidase subunit I [Blastopirellula]|uniref:Cytochrome oxidase subunit I n=1 Tax=Blastopirellula marina DSM 3645 TaxID=314230 RepID=A4A0M7_9BACT|nr:MULTISPECIES: cbb3-type cytochrome c oxidase subunit I [Blastopirellula]EAQ77693.1 cytochrome oxidase subunit I [Blastopirellula marina DSM 3645]UUO04883.1 cbb3-type cytochrome c oxidase subunit I [Blastopirellula sp. J2-11]
MSVGSTPDKFQAANLDGAQTREDNYLLASSGVGSWLFTLDHKRIGVMYLVGILVSFFLGGIFALILRAELFTGTKLFLTEDQYNQMFTLHGAVMTFLFIIPSIPAALGNFVLPVMLGQKDVAFPRMNLGSFYLWVVGAIFFLCAIIFGGLDTGWTFYTPYSVTTSTRVILALLGVFVLGFSSIFTGLNFIVTINTMRPHGMTWFKMPLFLWSIYATSIIQLLATPVLGITGLLLIAERALHIGIFDPEMGGDPVLFQHFFWFYSHPAVYIMILPAMGIISELIAVFSRKHIFGYRFIAYSSIAIALLGFLVWGHHMFVSGQSQLAAVVFSGLTFSVSIPSAIKVFNWLATMYKGSISLATPMCYALAFIFLFTIGGLTGLFLGALATDIQLHDTYFVVAHFHYVMMGGTLVAFVGGLYYWWPKMFGVMYNENAGRLFCLIVFLGFNLTFFPQFIMGARGMPRRYARYVEEFQIYHQLSTLGAFLLGIGMVGAIGVLLYSLYRGKKAPANPWGANTLEWMCSSPPPLANFDNPPPVGDPYDYSNLRYDEREGGYVTVPGPAKKTSSH